MAGPEGGGEGQNPDRFEPGQVNNPAPKSARRNDCNGESCSFDPCVGLESAGDTTRIAGSETIRKIGPTSRHIPDNAARISPPRTDGTPDTRDSRPESP